MYEVIKSLIKNGGCIIRNVLNQDRLALIESDVRPWIEKDGRWEGGDLFPPETRRVLGLVEKSKTFTEQIPGNRLFREVCDTLLTSAHDFWIGQNKETGFSNVSGVGGYETSDAPIQGWTRGRRGHLTRVFNTN